jgi:hypothetical protein
MLAPDVEAAWLEARAISEQEAEAEKERLEEHEAELRERLQEFERRWNEAVGR